MRVYCHPEVFNIVQKSFASEDIPTSYYYNSGIEIIIDKNLPKYAKKWVFPVHRYVDYEKTDEIWARLIKFGREEDDMATPIVMTINDEFIKPYSMFKQSTTFNPFDRRFSTKFF